MKRQQTTYLSENEIFPDIDLASVFESAQPMAFDYRIPSHHLMLIDRGSCAARTPHGDFTARAGDLICFRPTEYNHYHITAGTRFFQAHLQFAQPPRHRLTPWLENRGALPMKVKLGLRMNEGRLIFESFCMEMQDYTQASRLRLRAGILQLLALVSDTLALEGGPVKAVPDEWQRMRIRLESRLDHELSIESLARELSITPDHFIREFRQRFGLTPMNCRTHARLREGARLLRTGLHSIKEIAYQLGFKDRKSFTRLFKRHHGVLPSDMGQWSESGAGSAAPQKANALYEVNRFYLPPGRSEDWLKKYSPRRNPADSSPKSGK